MPVDESELDRVDTFDPTGTRDLLSVFPDLAAQEVIPKGLHPGPVPPLSGRYHGALAKPAGVATGVLVADLRVDIDGSKPLRMFSGDLFREEGSTSVYVTSFRVEELTASLDGNPLVLSLTGVPVFAARGAASVPGIGGAWDFAHATVEITWQPQSKAVLRLSRSGRTPGLEFECGEHKPFFRRIVYEEDRVQGVAQFSTFRMADDPGLPRATFTRELDIRKAFEEAGIEIAEGGRSEVISRTASAANPQGSAEEWDDSELFAAMTDKFQANDGRPSLDWSVWLLVADRYARERGEAHHILGMMFDQRGAAPRHGCAVFRSTIDEKAPGDPRIQARWALYACVHEIGHCFNLLHSFRLTGTSPLLSWMNYPDAFQSSGNRRVEFFRRFPFQFAARDLAHIRHGFLLDVMPGGSEFNDQAALAAFLDFDAPRPHNADLTLELRTPRPSFRYGEPVVVELKLARHRAGSAPRVHSALHPRLGLAQMAIEKPSGRVVRYTPLLESCVLAESARLALDDARPSLYDSAYIGFGSDGFYFDEIGMYRIRGTYRAPDGSDVVSAPIGIRVRSPKNNADEEVADCFFGREQGTLLYLLGSDAAYLKSGSEAFEELVRKHRTHPLAVYAHLVLGVNAGRDFKRIGSERRFDVRKALRKECVRRLSAVVDASEAGRGLDNISLNFVYRYLLAAYLLDSQDSDAERERKRMVDFFEQKKLTPFVLDQIKKEAERAYEAPQGVRF